MIKSKLRGIGIGITVAIAVMAGGITAYAATAISSISVKVVDNYDPEGTMLEPTVTVGGSHVTLSDLTWSRDVEKWKPGSEVTGTLLLSADDNYMFSSSYETKKISRSGCEVISAKRGDEDGLLILKIGYRPVVQLGPTERAGWSDATKTKAVWKKVEYATAYQLRLYRGDGEYVRTLTLEGTSVDLSDYITKETNYFYEVRATIKSTSNNKYLKTGEYVTSDDNTLENLGEVEGRWRKYSDGKKYVDTQGVAAVSSWRYIVGSWYYFDDKGYALTGWFNDGGKWYYMNSENKMMIGWLNLNDKWYFTDSTGAMVIGWYQVGPTDWYYFYEDGSMASNTVIDGFTLTGTGKMQ